MAETTTLEPFANWGTAVVDGLYDASTTGPIDLQTGEGAKLRSTDDGDFWLVWWNYTDYGDNPENDPNKEVIKVTDNTTTDTLDTIVRGEEGSGASTKNTSGKVYKVRQCITRGTLERFMRHTIGYEKYANETIDGSGVIVKNASCLNVSPNTTADDTLSTINAPSGVSLKNGELVLLRAGSGIYKITLDSAGNIDPGPHNISIKSVEDFVLLRYDGSNKWKPLFVKYDEPLWWVGNTTNSEIHTKWRTVAYDTSSYNDLGVSFIAEFHRDNARVLGINVNGYVSGEREFIEFFVDQVSKSSIHTPDGSAVHYGTFCGAHFLQFKDKTKEPPRGGVVIALDELVENEFIYYIEKTRVNKLNEETGEIEEIEEKKRHYRDEGDPGIDPKWERIEVDTNIGIHKKIPYLDSTIIRKDKRVIGVHSGSIGGIDSRRYAFGKNDRPLESIAALGEYVIRVTDTNGNIENGDYLQSSTREWEAEKQDDDILHSYTVAKARISVDFSTIPVDPDLGYKWKLIPCILPSN